ncbi:MAG TPA: T9SS type A sorting domain-containing protein, partial [candidate division Zixibacteria bacterium]|nr:T9SS type A sorting domain-containing protein [candidate division Zixibacteria bacterium]
NPATTISCDLPSKSNVRLTVYNVLGQEVITLIDREMDADQHSVSWDASKQASGVYFYRLEAGSFTETRKMLLLK